MGNFRTLCLVSVVAASSQLLIACAEMVVRRPTVVGYNQAERAEVWNRAVLLLQSRNYAFRILNEASGTISTEPIDIGAQPCGITECQARQTVSLTVSPSGSIVCNINRTLRSALVSEPFEPSNEQGVRAVEDAQAEIVRTILAGPVVASSGGAAVASAEAPSPAPAPAPTAPRGRRCYTTAGAAVTAEGDSCAAIGLADAPPAPLRCFTPTGASVPVDVATCDAAGLSAIPPAAAPAAAPETPAPPVAAARRNHHH